MNVKVWHLRLTNLPSGDPAGWDEWVTEHLGDEAVGEAHFRPSHRVNYLSKRGAYNKAAFLSRFGVTVEIIELTAAVPS